MGGDGLDSYNELGIEGLSDVSVMATGGSSTVYRGHQPAMDRPVAIKVIHEAWNAETQARVERERQIMGRLSGQSDVVPILDAGVTRRGEPYLLMPYYQRGSLSRLLADRGALPWREAVFLVEQSADALADAHQAGIVHRDIKPGNILLTDYLRPRLTDFGIALAIGDTTTPATLAYSPTYSAPETHRPGVVEPSIDVFGLGATLWTLIAGTPPGPDSSSAASLPVSLPQRLVSIMDSALAIDPSDRPADAATFASLLRQLSARSPEPSVVAPVQSGVTRHGINLCLLVGAIVIGVALIALGLWVLG